MVACLADHSVGMMVATRVERLAGLSVAHRAVYWVGLRAGLMVEQMVEQSVGWMVATRVARSAGSSAAWTAAR